MADYGSMKMFATVCFVLPKPWGGGRGCGSAGSTCFRRPRACPARKTRKIQFAWFACRVNLPGCPLPSSSLVLARPAGCLRHLGVLCFFGSLRPHQFRLRRCCRLQLESSESSRVQFLLKL